MLTEYLNQIREREAKATAAPWVKRIHPNGDDRFVEHPREPGQPYGVEILGDDDYATKDADCDFVSGARQDIPKLLSLVEKAVEGLNEIERVCQDRIAGQVGYDKEIHVIVRTKLSALTQLLNESKVKEGA